MLPTMMRPNWFDVKYSASVQMTASDFLAEIAKDPKIIQAVQDAMTTPLAATGPSRTQLIRNAIVGVLQQ